MNRQNQVPFNKETDEKRIVVINTAFLGDLVLTIPFLMLLRQKFTNAKIGLVCKKGIGDFFIKLKLVDQIYEVQKGSSDAYAVVAQEINRQSVDYLFCIHRSFRSYLLSLRIKAQYRYGYRLNFNLIGFHKKVTRNLNIPEPLRILQLLTLVDDVFADFFATESKYHNYNEKLNTQHMVDVPRWADFPNVSLPSVDHPLKPEIQSILDQLPKGGNAIAVFPGSVWNTKRWPVEHFASLTQQLLKNGHSVILMGGPGEEVYGDVIEQKLGTTAGLVNLIGKSSVWESILVLHQCELVVANDSASAHLAALLGKKILVFFGPTVLNFGYRPWGNHVYVLENTQLSCRPCGSHGHDECPIKTHVCMTSIDADSAFRKVESILD
jgi:heptosyltransferase-2